MTDPALSNLLRSLEEDDLDAVLVLADFLEERGDPRADQVRKVYLSLYDEWMFAPFSFRHFKLIREGIYPLFPEIETV